MKENEDLAAEKEGLEDDKHHLSNYKCDLSIAQAGGHKVLLHLQQLSPPTLSPALEKSRVDWESTALAEA
jgi:hypothetical protein